MLLIKLVRQSLLKQLKNKQPPLGGFLLGTRQARHKLLDLYKMVRAKENNDAIG